MRRPRLTRVAALLLAVAASACSDSPTGPGSEVQLDAVLAEMSLESIVPASVSVGAPVGLMGGPRTDSCSYSASVQSFVCAPVTRDGMTMTHEYMLLAANGQPQSAFDRATTDAVRTTSTMTGTLAFEGFASAGSSTIDSRQTMTLSGLLTGTHVLDGLHVMKMASTYGELGTHRSTFTTLTEGLVLPERRSGGYPKSGSITTTIASDDALLGLDPYVMKMVFNGTNIVNVTFTQGSYTRQCTIDLSARGLGDNGAGTCFSELVLR